MAAKTLLIRVSSLVSFLDVTLPDGSSPEGTMRSDAIKALWEAARQADGSPTTIDGDVELDLEGTSGDEDVAIEVLSYELERRGYEVFVVHLIACSACREAGRTDCSTCGGRGEGMPPDFSVEPVKPEPWSGTVWHCYACSEVLSAHAPYTSGCPHCLGPKRHHELGGNPRGCPQCGGELELLCDHCDQRERQRQEGENVPMPKPPESQGDA